MWRPGGHVWGGRRPRLGGTATTVFRGGGAIGARADSTGGVAALSSTLSASSTPAGGGSSEPDEAPTVVWTSPAATGGDAALWVDVTEIPRTRQAAAATPHKAASAGAAPTRCSRTWNGGKFAEGMSGASTSRERRAASAIFCSFSTGIGPPTGGVTRRSPRWSRSAAESELISLSSKPGLHQSSRRRTGIPQSTSSLRFGSGGLPCSGALRCTTALSRSVGTTGRASATAAFAAAPRRNTITVPRGIVGLSSMKAAGRTGRILATGVRPPLEAQDRERSTCAVAPRRASAAVSWTFGVPRPKKTSY